MRKISLALGFSLIELMVVVSIVCILTALGLPSYQNYTKRARFTEVIGAAGVYKTAVALALQQGAVLTELYNGAHGIPEAPKATKNVAEVKVVKGTVVATGTALVEGATYILKPNEDGSGWTVSGSCLKSGLCSA